MQLADELHDWADWDGASYALGRSRGLFRETDFLAIKRIFWTDNDLGNGLHDALLALAAAGVLARRDELMSSFGGSAGRDGVHQGSRSACLIRQQEIRSGLVVVGVVAAMRRAPADGRRVRLAGPATAKPHAKPCLP
jgi:hypothetical protein